MFHKNVFNFVLLSIPLFLFFLIFSPSVGRSHVDSRLDERQVLAPVPQRETDTRTDRRRRARTASCVVKVIGRHSCFPVGGRQKAMETERRH